MAIKNLTKDQLFASAKPKLEKVELPQGTVYAKQWTLRESDEIHACSLQRARTENPEVQDQADTEWRSKVNQYAICDDKGEPLFDNDTINEYTDLTQEIVTLMLKGALSVNGMKAIAEAAEEGTQSPN